MRLLPIFFMAALARAVLTTTAPVAGQTPAIKPFTYFALPLTDDTIANAILLPAADGQAYITYATSQGGLVVYRVTGMEPGPNPVPPPVPPPTPTKLTIAIVEDPRATTKQQRDVLADKAWRKLAKEKHDFLGIIPKDLTDRKTGQPPPRLAPFLERAKLHDLPWVMFTDPTGAIIWEGPLPPIGGDLCALIRTYGT